MVEPNKKEEEIQAASSSQVETGDLDVRGIAIRTAMGIVLIILVVGVLGFVFRKPLLGLSGKFVGIFGGFGVALGFFVIDGFTVPFPNDAFTFFGLNGGISFWMVVFWASLGSLVGGSVGYLIGLRVGKARWFVKFMEGRGADTYQMIRGYGLIALGIAAFTPIPYSIATWASGAVKIPFGQFLLVSLLRIPRIALYLWLIQIGFVKFAS